MMRSLKRICILWIFTGLVGFGAFSNPAGLDIEAMLEPPPILGNPSACNLGLTIPDFSCNSNNVFQINVTSAPGNSLGTNVFLQEVRLIITHPWAADLDIHLVSPTGVRVELSTDNGSGDDDYGKANGVCNQWTAFISSSAESACGAKSILQGHPPFIGNFLPEGNLNDFNTGASPIGLWALEVCDDGREHVGRLEYVELVFGSVTCIAPSAISLVSVDSTSVMLDWKPGSNCSATIIEYGLPGLLPGSGATGNGIVQISGCPPWKLTGLNPATPYELYIREQCGPGSFSANSCKISFTTKCSPPPATISEDFNTQVQCDPVCGVPCNITGSWRNASNDHFDWTIHSGASPTTQTGAMDDIPGSGKYAYIETTGSLCQFGNEAILISNCIEVKANSDSCDLSFNFLLNGAHVNALYLEATLDGGMNWQTLWQAVGHQGTEWQVKYIDLDAFHGKTVQFRFLARGGNGPRGDIAIDNIKFYGSLDLGAPTYNYYYDGDGDGYGRSDKFISTCQPATFAGYVDLAGDCDDDEPLINPGATESPCDGIDLNCNGMADEGLLPPPEANDVFVCSGAAVLLRAVAGFGGSLEWYSSPSGGTSLFKGDTFAPLLPLNTSPNPAIHKFYVEEVVPGGCISVSRKEVKATIQPQPDISAGTITPVCSGSSIDLTSVNVVDANGANGQISFYSKWPYIPANKIGPVVSVNFSTNLHIVSETQSGCMDSVIAPLAVLSRPDIMIEGPTIVCGGGSAQLKALHLSGGSMPFTYAWSNGASTSEITVTGSPAVGQSQKYTVTVHDSKGCESRDSLTLSSVASITGVNVNVTPVSSCNGKDGAIILTPLSGTGPFIYDWNGGSSSTQPGSFSINNLSQGTYAFTVTDNSPMACPFIVPVILVNGPAAQVSIKEVKNVSCAGGNDTCITLEVNGSNPSILWSTGATTKQICGLSVGIYRVTVTDGSCINTLNIPVTQPQPLTASALVSDVNCKGTFNGKVEVSVFGGTAPYQFLWNNGATVQTLNNLSGGVYKATITDAKGCQVFITDAKVLEPEQLDASVSEWKPVSCFGMFDGKISVVPSGGIAPFSFLWNNGAAGSAISNVPAGNYSLTITDANKCKVTKVYELPQPLPVSVKIDTIINPVCKGIHNGEIRTTPQGGNGVFQFLWNNGKISKDITNLAPGNFLLTLKDQLGCQGKSDTIKLSGPESMVVEIDRKDPTCVGIDDGHLIANVKSGGEAPFKYFWSTDFSGTSLFNLAAVPYGLTVTDNKGCRFDTTLNLIAAQPISVKHSSFAPPCAGTSSGQLSLQITGSLQPYSVIWSTGQQGADIAGLPAANYSATITDASGCQQFTGLIPLIQPPALTVKTETVEGLVCNGESEGRIDVTVSGGTPPYKYFWSNNKNTQDIFGLKEGTYRLTVTDAANCVTTAGPFTVAAPSPVIASVAVREIKPCETVVYENVCLSVSGGMTPYKYEWSNNAASACLTKATVGDYSVTVTDAAGCSKTVNSVKVPDNFFPVSVSKIDGGTQKICTGASNGSLIAVIKGGVKPFQYIWSSGVKGITNHDTLRLENLSASDFRVTITDNTGCVAVSGWMTIESSQPLQATIPGNQIMHVRCKSGKDGSINVNISGGFKPYFFTWTNTQNQVIANTEDISGLGPGIYQLVVRDSIGCSATLQAIINEPQNVLGISGQALIQPVACYENQNGSININVSGGIPPYRYQWNNGKTTEDVHMLLAGTYQVTITDSNNCSIVSPVFKVDGPTAKLSVASAQVGNISCFGKTDGYLNLTMTGGVEPYTFLWDLPSQNKNISHLSKGTYRLSVTDKNLCRLDTAFTIKEPPLLNLTTGSSPSVNGGNDGKAFASAFGGSSPYIYTWYNGFKGDTLKNLAAGMYAVTVQDYNLCETSTSVKVGNIVAESGRSVNKKISLSPNPTISTTTLSFSGFTLSSASVKIFNHLGQLIRILNKNELSENVSFDLGNEPSGIYFVVVFEDNKPVYSSKLAVLRN